MYVFQILCTTNVVLPPPLKQEEMKKNVLICLSPELFTFLIVGYRCILKNSLFRIRDHLSNLLLRIM